MKLTRKIKKRALPKFSNGFADTSKLYMDAGYYKNRGIAIPWLEIKSIGSYESFRFIMS